MRTLRLIASAAFALLLLILLVQELFHRGPRPEQLGRRHYWRGY
jgi:hypothetical protein